MVAVHRADLQAALLATLGPGVVRTGATCTSFHQDDAQVWAHLADGEQIPGDLLIGADGIRSTVRAQLIGETPLRYSGYTAWRGVAQAPPPQWDAATATESWGAGMRFGLVPLSNGRMYWFATMNAPAGAQDPPGGRKQELRDRFAQWHEPIPAVIAATDEAAILRNDIYDRPPIEGQGACQAIEDAVALAAQLRAGGTVELALAAYEAQRLTRANTITQQSLRLGQVGQWENRWAVAARDAIFKRLPASVLGKTLETALEPA
jgi:2-polyprenyl-6-methoxyphenol hydroxylase-like FAD-dependent oxidoreductase